MIASSTSMRGIEAAGLAAGALFAVACMPVAAAEFSARPDATASTELCEPARWTGKAAPATKVAATVTKVADQLDAGWWVVLATVPTDQDVQETVRNLEACRLRPFNDFSSKFAGFAPGFQVVVDGAYATRSEAESVRSAASRCAPDAYVKRARYLGE